MPLLLLLLLLVVAVPVVLMPLSLIWRYRAGTARRQARGWLATLNVAGFGVSILLFLTVAAATTMWVPMAFAGALAGLAAGGVVALLGLALTRWEPSPGALHFTPNRWLILTLTLVVAGRVGYGFWRGWHAWQAATGHESWIASAGVSGSLAAGALVLGYHVVYWMGVRRRLQRLAPVRRIPSNDRFSRTGFAERQRPL